MRIRTPTCLCGGTQLSPWHSSAANAQPGFTSCLPPAPTSLSSPEASDILWLIWTVLGTLPSPALNLTGPELYHYCATHQISVSYKEASLRASCQLHVSSHLLTASGSSSLTAPCHSVIISALSAVSGWVLRCSWGQSAISPKAIVCLRRKI